MAQGTSSMASRSVLWYRTSLPPQQLLAKTEQRVHQLRVQHRALTFKGQQLSLLAPPTKGEGAMENQRISASPLFSNGKRVSSASKSSLKQQEGAHVVAISDSEDCLPHPACLPSPRSVRGPKPSQQPPPLLSETEETPGLEPNAMPHSTAWSACCCRDACASAAWYPGWLFGIKSRADNLEGRDPDRSACCSTISWRSLAASLPFSPNLPKIALCCWGVNEGSIADDDSFESPLQTAPWNPSPSQSLPLSRDEVDQHLALLGYDLQGKVADMVHRVVAYENSVSVSALSSGLASAIEYARKERRDGRQQRPHHRQQPAAASIGRSNLGSAAFNAKKIAVGTPNYLRPKGRRKARSTLV
jgi:hypothetical protein